MKVWLAMDSKALKLINEIEDEFGSITSCPEDDPRLLKVRSILESRNASSLIRLTEQMIKKGYQVSEVVNEACVNRNKIYDIQNKYNFTVKPRFKYLARKGNIIIHSPNMANLARALNLKVKRSDIKNKGWILFREITRWEQISDGDYYVDKYDIIYIKRGIDSFRKNRIYNLME